MFVQSGQLRQCAGAVFDRIRIDFRQQFQSALGDRQASGRLTKFGYPLTDHQPHPGQRLRIISQLGLGIFGHVVEQSGQCRRPALLLGLHIVDTVDQKCSDRFGAALRIAYAVQSDQACQQATRETDNDRCQQGTPAPARRQTLNAAQFMLKRIRIGPLRRLWQQHGANQCCHGSAHDLLELARRFACPFGLLCRLVLHGLRQFAKRRLVQHCAQGIHIRARCGRSTTEQLRRHGGRRSVSRSRADFAASAEVHEYRPLAAHHYIADFDIPMHETGLVYGRKRRRQLPRNSENCSRVQTATLAQDLLERFAIE